MAQPRIRKTRRIPARLEIPRLGVSGDMAQYVEKFSKLNGLAPSPFIINGKVVLL